MVVGRGSTEPVSPITDLTPTETKWANQVRKHLDELNKLLSERGARFRYTVDREYV
jgi:hypothetical protein